MRIFFIALFIAAASQVLAQAEQPVRWTFALSQAEAAQPERFTVTAHAEIEQGWYVYGQFLEAGGPIATAIDFSGTPGGFKLVGMPTETGDAISGHDKLFDMHVTKFKHAADFIQTGELVDGQDELKGTLTFMTCTDETCLPPKTIDVTLSRKTLSASH